MAYTCLYMYVADYDVLDNPHATLCSVRRKTLASGNQNCLPFLVAFCIRCKEGLLGTVVAKAEEGHIGATAVRILLRNGANTPTHNCPLAHFVQQVCFACH